MRLQQEFSIRTFIPCLFAGTVRPSVVSCILYQSSGTSWGVSPHCCVAALCFLIKMKLNNVPVAVQLQVRHHQHASPAPVSYPKSIWLSGKWTCVMVLNLDVLWEACGNCVPLSTSVCTRITLYSLSLPLSCVLCLCRFDLNFPRSVSLRSSFSVFLPSSK